MTRAKLPLAVCFAACTVLVTTTIAASEADAQRRGGGGHRAARPASGTHHNLNASNRAGRGQAHQNHQVRRDASTNINHNANRNMNRDVNRNVNRDVNRNVNRDLNVDVDVHHDHDWDYGWGDHYHPVARAAVATAAVATTAAIVGSYYRTLPPSCVTVYRGSVTYYQCGSAWYQPVYSGSTIQYVVVEAP